MTTTQQTDLNDSVKFEYKDLNTIEKNVYNEIDLGLIILKESYGLQSIKKVLSILINKHLKAKT